MYPIRVYARDAVRGDAASATASLPNRMSEKCPSGGIARRSIRCCLRPAHIAPPCELGAPAQPPRRRREPMLERATQPGLRADAADQNDLATGLENAGELVECSLRVGNGRDHILGDDHV